METGLTALRNVVEESVSGREPAQILLLLTVELTVREKTLKLYLATLEPVQVTSVLQYSTSLYHETLTSCYGCI